MVIAITSLAIGIIYFSTKEDITPVNSLGFNYETLVTNYKNTETYNTLFKDFNTELPEIEFTDEMIKKCKEDIEKAVKDAEAHASEDKKKKEEIEVRNNAESLVYNSEKTLKELGDKISGEEKAKVETEISNTKKALEGTDIENIKQATEKLTTVFYEISEKLYKQASAAQDQANGGTESATGDANGENPDGTVYDAEYVEDDSNNK